MCDADVVGADGVWCGHGRWEVVKVVEEAGGVGDR